jgi:GYF domain 2
MPNRSWYCAYQGQQLGPYPEAQFREFIASGRIRADTLVWNEGMVDWQKAGDIPGLISPITRPPAVPGGMSALPRAPGNGSLSVDFEILDFVKQALLFLFGAILVIPLPWVLIRNLRWVVSTTRVPGRPDLNFTGQAVTILPWYFGAIVLLIVLAFVPFGNRISVLLEIGLGWLSIQWFVANLASNDEPLGLSFSGSFWGYLGWSLLSGLSVITIIGWAWVHTAQIRWICRHIQGTHREIVYKATGLEYLWRGIIVFFGCALIIPIPWLMRWFMQWQASQTVLVEPGA